MPRIAPRWGEPAFDSSKASPELLESLARFRFDRDRIQGFSPFLIGAWLDALFLGVVLIATAVWWQHARATDRAWCRWLVYWLLFAGVLSSSIVQGSVVSMFGAGFGQFRGVFDVTWYKWHGLGTIACRLPSSGFYLHRAYSLIGRQKWILVAVVPMLCMMAVSAITPAFMLKNLPSTRELQIFILCGSVCDVTSDLVLTTTIGVQLYKSRTGWRGTDALIMRLVIMVGKCQAPITLFMLAWLLITVLMPNTTTVFAFMCVTKLHTLCILITLLSRVSIARSVRGGSSNCQSKSTPSGLHSAGSAGSDGRVFISYSQHREQQSTTGRGVYAGGADKLEDGHAYELGESGSTAALTAGREGVV